MEEYTYTKNIDYNKFYGLIKRMTLFNKAYCINLRNSKKNWKTIKYIGVIKDISTEERLVKWKVNIHATIFNLVIIQGLKGKYRNN